MIKGYREFILRGNVMDLAIGIVMGLAFKAVIDAVVAGLINPIVAAIFGKPNLDSVMTFTINDAVFSIGVILTQLINFLAVAAAVYFVVVVPITKLRARFEKPEEVAAEVDAEEVILLREIRDALRNPPTT